MPDVLFCFRLNVFLRKFNTNFLKTNTIITSIKYSINLQLRKSILRSIKIERKTKFKQFYKMKGQWNLFTIMLRCCYVSSCLEVDTRILYYHLKLPWRHIRKEITILDYQKMEILFFVANTLISICIFIALAQAAMRSIKKKIKLIILILFSFLLSFLKSAIIQVNP